ncbi:MAG: CoA-binding protein [Candidatus Hydrogenedentota bacterium]|nr:MAG: CoA-binding protein [Candidatus Hydrogenedentota bacterium]
MNWDLAEFLRTKPKIALVGATNDSRKYGNKIFLDLTRKGFEVIPINPKAKTVEGVTAYPDLASIPEKQRPQLVVYVVPPKITLQSIQQALQLGFTKFWIQPGAGDETVRDALEQATKENSEVRYLMDACVMVESA